MPDFVNPFSGMVPRKMTKEELLRALRLDLAAEEEAIHAYTAHADATDDELAKKVLLDIADEERVHVGEFQRLINLLAPEEPDLLAAGAAEVDAMAAGQAEAETKSESPPDREPTVGDLTKSG